MKLIDDLLCKLGYHHTKNIYLATFEHPLWDECDFTFYCTNCGKTFFQSKCELETMKHIKIKQKKYFD